VAELTTRLVDRGHEAADVDAVVAALRAEGLLDDERLARTHARTASAIKGRGRHRIRRELEARGIDRGLADRAVSDLSRADEAETLRRLVERKTRGRALDMAGERRLFQQLLRRGFDTDAIRRMLAATGVRSRRDGPPEE
jgi:regulatory protein